MAQGREHGDPYWNSPFAQNSAPLSPTFYGAGDTPPRNSAHPIITRNNYGAPNGRGYSWDRDTTEYQKQPNGKLGHPNPTSGYSRHPPSRDGIDDLQSRIRNMLTSESKSPSQQTALPISSRGRPARGLHHSPPFHRGLPPSSPKTHNQRSRGRELPWDSCEDITAYALGIVKSLEIPDDERQEKEEFCRGLDEIVKRIRPTAKLEVFGSFANTFTIANSDIDCCVTDPNSTSDEIRQSGLPELLQTELDALGLETTLLTLTRIPILKVFRPPTNLLDSTTTNIKLYKYPLHCDVGWQNRLALHNTALLKAYSNLDTRVREIVLFVKYWTKTRMISRPRYGTLCSYGYALMILYYLTHIVSPPVLPNLQTLPPKGVTRLEDLECDGCNVYFSKDGNGWKSWNNESIGELIKGFFNFFAFEWHFKKNVISIRSINGMLTKESKGWTTLAESPGPQSHTVKSRYLIAIEDPFEISHNVARTVNALGLSEIRGEFIRAAKMLNNLNGRRQWLTDICNERVVLERPMKPRGNGAGENSGAERMAETGFEPEMEGDGVVRVSLPPVNAAGGQGDI